MRALVILSECNNFCLHSELDQMDTDSIPTFAVVHKEKRLVLLYNRLFCQSSYSTTKELLGWRMDSNEPTSQISLLDSWV